MALSAMRTNKVTGSSSSGQRDVGINASQAPCAMLRASAPPVIALAVSPARTRRTQIGRSSA